LAQDQPTPAAPAQKPAEAPAISALAGDWQSDWGPVTLSVEGSHVTGAWQNGRFEGDFDPFGVLHFQWVQKDGVSGKGNFLVTNDGRMIGTWGFQLSVNDGGVWLLAR